MIYKKIKKFIVKNKLLIFFCFICVLLEILMDLLLPITLSKVINIGIYNNDTNYILKNVILMIIILLIGIFGSIVSTYISSKLSSSFSYELRNQIIKKLFNLEYTQIDEINIGNTITLLTNDMNNIENIIFLMLKILVKIPLVIVGSIILCLTISIKLSSILLIIVPIIVVISIIFIKKTYPYFTLTSETLDEMNTDIRENINNIKLVKAYNREKYEKNKFDLINKKYKEIDTRALKILSLMMPIIIFIINITIILVLIYGKLVFTNNLVGNITAFIEYINLLLSSIIGASMIILLVIQSGVSIKRINHILKLHEEILNDGIKKRLKGKIEFKNVSFGYNKKYNLENINLKILPGEHVAIVGTSSSGKTTLVNLIKDNYEIKKGSILIDDIDINNYDKKYLKEHIEIINQKNNVFKDTFINNIRFNKKIDINKYLKLTLSDKILHKKNNDLNYIIEQNGKNLSGGEKQRLILCRTLINNPDILILDDSLSALDLKTEKQIINNLLKEYKNKTIIFITSRLKSIKNFDKIVLLDNGEIKSIGNHDKLLKNPIYNELYNIGGNLYE